MGASTRQYVASTICQLSVLVSGIAYSWFEPFTIRLTQDPELAITDEDVSWLISIIELGCVVSPFIAGDLTNRVGRKYVILSVGPLCMAGWVMILSSKTFMSLCTARVLHGLGVGIAFTLVPLYTAEIANPKIRGGMGGTFQVCWYLGSLFAFGFGPYLSYDVFAWVCLTVAAVFTVFVMFLPETPYFLLMTERQGEARKVLKWLRNSVDVEEELLQMNTAVSQEMSEKSSWKVLFHDKTEKKALLLVLVVCTAKFLTGMPVIANYALHTFSKSESFLHPVDMSIALCFLLTTLAVVSTCMSDWIGRKPLLLFSCFGCFLAHLFTGSYYFLHEATTVDARPYIWLMYGGLVMYCFFSDIGVSPLVQTLQSEMFGARTRGTAAGITEGFAAILAFVVLKVYSPISEYFGVYVNFWLYSAVGLVCGVLLSCLMYETAGKTIGQMERQNKEIT